MIQDITHEIKRLPKDRKALKHFCATFFVLCGAFAIMIFFQHKIISLPWLVGAGIGGILWCMVPSWLTPLYLAWMGFACVLGWIMSRVLLTIIFVCIITPLGLFLRLKGKDILDQRIDSSATTYWKPCESIVDKNRYQKPF